MTTLMQCASDPPPSQAQCRLAGRQTACVRCCRRKGVGYFPLCRQDHYSPRLIRLLRMCCRSAANAIRGRIYDGWQRAFVTTTANAELLAVSACARCSRFGIMLSLNPVRRARLFLRAPSSCVTWPAVRTRSCATTSFVLFVGASYRRKQ